MEIKTGFQIYNEIANDTTDLEDENHPYNIRYIKLTNKDFKFIMHHIIKKKLERLQKQMEDFKTDGASTKNLQHNQKRKN